MITILNAPLPQNQYSTKAPYAMKPVGITIHETDNEASAKNEIAYMQRNSNRVSFHYAVDNEDIIQGLPLDRNGWHAGDGTNGKGNRTTLAIEICGNYRRSGSVGQPTSWYYEARKNAEKLTGYLLFKYGWTDKHIHTHYDWVGKNCPRVILREKYMNEFKKNAMAWKKKFEDANKKPTTPSKPSTPSDNNVIPKGKAVINSGAVYRSLSKTYDGKKVPSDRIDVPMDYALNRVKGKDWVFFPSIMSYVARKDVTIGQEVADGKIEVGDKVEYNGYLYRNSAGGGKGSKVNGTFEVEYLNKNSHGVHLKGKGWVKLADVKKVGSTGTSKPSTPSTPKPTPKPKNKHGQNVQVGDKIQFSVLYNQDVGGRPTYPKNLYYTEKRGNTLVGYGYVIAITDKGYRVSNKKGGSTTIGFVRPVNTY